MIPIVLLHHNQPDVLADAVACISERTVYPYLLFVVDNASDSSDELEALFATLEQRYNAIIIRNKHNNWIYGFNLAIDDSRWPSSKYYVFSDADILVPHAIENRCWLEQMVDEMEQNRCIGKLGISLNLDGLAQMPELRSTYEMELKYYNGEKIGNNVISPVDTTLAIYRSNYFIGRFRFRIGHQSLSRPYYYTCRTRMGLSAEHVGWNFYPGVGAKSYSLARQWKKAFAMSKMGTYTAPEILNKFSLPRKIFLIGLRNVVRAIHVAKVSIAVFFFVAKRFPRSINEIQAQVR
jgi:glycosyltransferase involved in cell wall biosynthesis